MQSLSLGERPQLIHERSLILNPSQNGCTPTTWRHCQCFLAVCHYVSSNFRWSKWFVSVIHDLEVLIDCLKYGATKAGILGMTKTDAIAYATDGIRVNCVLPGWVKTPSKSHFACSATECKLKESSISGVRTTGCQLFFCDQHHPGQTLGYSRRDCGSMRVPSG